MRYFRILIVIQFVSIVGVGQQHKGFRWIDGNHNLYQVDRKLGVVSKQTLGNETLALAQSPGGLKLRRSYPMILISIFLRKGMTHL
jgi:hypothetical protein